MFDRNMPKWMDEFLTIYKADKQMKKEADVHVEDLPKITWNDQIYYVLFDTDKATNKPYAHIINKYGNNVTSIPSATNMDEVEFALKSKTFISRQESDMEKQMEEPDLNVFDEELKKAAAYLNEEQDVVVFDQEEEKALPSDERIAQLENTVKNLTAQVEQLIKAQEYARVNVVDCLDNNAAEFEKQKMDESIKETEQYIQIEHSHDLTTPEGRSQLTQALEDFKSELNVDYLADEDGIKELVELDEPESEVFKERVCPMCEEKEQMVIEKQDEKVANIVCPTCESQYLVNKIANKIYYKK